MKRMALAAGVFLYAFVAFAGERLPEGILVHASAKSLVAAVDNLDALAAACVKDTPAAQQFKPGMLAMMIGAFSPLPQGAWDSKGEINAALVMAAPMSPQPIVIVKTPGLAAFKKAMAEGGAALDGDGKKMSATLPKLKQTWYFADVGGGRVAGAMSEAARDLTVKAMAAGWSPKHATKADLALNADLKNLIAAYRPIYDAGLAQFKKQFEKNDGNMKNVPEAMKPLVAALATVIGNVVAKLEGEIPTLNNLGLDLSFDGDRLKLAFSLTSDKGSGLDILRAAYSSKGKQKYSLVSSLPEETILFDASSDLSILPNGLMDLYAESIRTVAEAVMPEHAEELAGLPREFQALGIRDCTAGSYMSGDKPIVAIYGECAKPKEFLAFVPKTIELGQIFVDTLLKMAGGENVPAVAMEYEPDAGKIGSVPYHRIAVELKRPGSDGPIRYDALFAVGKKNVIAVYGQVEEDDLWYAISNYQGTVGDFVTSGAFVNAEPVRKSLDAIENRQLKLMALRPLEAIASFLVGQAAMTGGDVEAAREAAAKIIADPVYLALGAGATGKAMTMEFVLPAEIVNDFIKNAEAISALRAVIESGSAESPQMDHGDVQEGGDSEEEVYFDDPVQ